MDREEIINHILPMIEDVYYNEDRIIAGDIADYLISEIAKAYDNGVKDTEKAILKPLIEHRNDINERWEKHINKSQSNNARWCNL